MSHFILSGNWLTNNSVWGSAWGQYDLDIGLVPFFRRYVFKDPNPEKAKRFSLRVGYLQVSDLKDDPNGFDEKRPFIEGYFRMPVGRSWLYEDRNRGEYRIFHDDNVARYRNRLRIERAVRLNKFRMTPYTSGEIFYDGTSWNEGQTALGVDLPIYQKMVLELECMTQFINSRLNTVSFGFMIQKFI
jgi:hypothetical protein